MSCSACREGTELPFDFTMAFQPIIDMSKRTVWAYEALVRGCEGQGAGWVLSQLTQENRYAFDQACRVKAIELAARLFPAEEPPILSINFMPNAVYVPSACIRTTLKAADETNFPVDRIMLEITEGERIEDVQHVKTIIEEYKKRRLITAIDDFGAGFSGLGLLADFQPDVIKLDMGLIRGLDTDSGRQAIVKGIVSTARLLGTTVIAEGIEIHEELDAIRELGVDLVQGYLFAHPEIEALPPVSWPEPDEARLRSAG